MSTPTPTSPIQFEHHVDNTIGIGEARPRLSWRVGNAPHTYRQLGYRLEVTTWRAGETPQVEILERDGDEQVLVSWPVAPLTSRTRVSVRVQLRGPEGWGEWGAAGSTETGLLDPADWVAKFVGPPWEQYREGCRRPGRVRGFFSVPSAQVESARLYITAHGLVEAEINGQRVGDEVLAPGWTSYSHRLLYSTFDVTDMLARGDNAIGLWMGDGWYRGRIGFEGGRANIYGDRLEALAQLEIMTVDGERIVVASDDMWQAGFGPILSSSLYDGEHFDARLDDPAWSTPLGSRNGWAPVHVTDPDLAVLAAPMARPVRRMEQLVPVSLTKLDEGRFLLDFGQNHSGRLRLHAPASTGTRVTIRHAEVLQDGELYTRTLRKAAATDVLTLAAEPISWEPRFTIHGYRYAEISGWPGDLSEADVTSVVIHSDMERIGWFECSNPLTNRLHENVLWSLRSNFVSIPTDCPQRDERLGWTGDIQVFAPTASFLYDVTAFLDSWLRDVASEQRALDFMPVFVPYIDLPFWGEQIRESPMAVWGDVTVLTPSVLWERAGDLGVAAAGYGSAKAWLGRVEAAAGPSRICDSTMQLGDWLDPAAPPDEPFKAVTPADLVATAYFAYSARRLSELAGLLGEVDDVARYASLAAEVEEAYQRHYFGADGDILAETQTALALTEVFDLFPSEAARQRGGERLAELVRSAGGALATGFAGTPIVCDALTRTGHVDEAFLLLLHEQCPSWLYTVRQGATTIWERWDSMLPDGTVNPGDMTSFNHYALGAVADWLQRSLAGIAPAAPGYREIRFEPHPGGGITSASARHRTPYGDASIDWEINAATLTVVVEVPVGAHGTVVLPGRAPISVGQGRHVYANIPAADGNDVLEALLAG